VVIVPLVDVVDSLESPDGLVIVELIEFCPVAIVELLLVAHPNKLIRIETTIKTTNNFFV